MGGRFSPAQVLLALALLGCIFGAGAEDISVSFNSTSVVIQTITENSTTDLTIYPPVNGQPVDTCPDAPWKGWDLHRTPPEYNPLNWNSQEWRQYILNYPLRSAGLSIAFLLIGILTLMLAVVWRLVQWCVSCGHCQRGWAVGSEDTHFLGDTKHGYLKAWIYLLITAAIAMVIWGMLAMDRGLLTDFWAAFLDVMDYGKSITTSLQELEANLTVGVPTLMRNIVESVNDTIHADRLGILVQASVDFNNATLVTTASLLANVTAIQAAMSTQVIPGVEALGVQFGSPVVAATTAAMAAPSTSSSGSTSARRHLAQSGSPAQSSDTLYKQLPALRASLPVIQAADDNRSNILGRLKSLGDALAAAQSATSPDSPELAALDNALRQTSLTTWDNQLGQAVAALQAYNISRNGPALPATKAAADQVLSGGAAVSPTQLSQVMAQLDRTQRDVTGGYAYTALRELVVHLTNISNEVLDISNWTVPLQNGTRVPLLMAASTMLKALTECITGNTTNGAAAVDDFVKGTSDAGAAVARINATNLSNLTTSALNLVRGGPDPSPAASQVNATLRPALLTLNSPVASVSALLATYRADPTATRLASLNSAITVARASVANCSALFTPPLVNASALQSTAQSLTPVLGGLSDAGAAFQRASAELYSELDGANADITGYLTNLQQLTLLLQNLPNGTLAKKEVAQVAGGVQDKLSTVSQSLTDSLGSAASSLNNTVNQIESRVLYPANNFINKNRQRTEAIVNIVYPVIMACWALGALLLLLLALSVARNWPAGLVTIGLTLLIYIILSQAVTAVVAFAMGAVDDACNDAETVVMRQSVRKASDPAGAILLSFYMYHVPDTPSIMLQAAVGLNVTNVRAVLNSVNETLYDKIESLYRLKGTTLTGLGLLRTLGNAAFSMFEDIMRMMAYETIHGLYAHTKAVVCCSAGNFVYWEWCAITAMATITFGALVPVGYLLARMDMVRQRRRACCSCCACVCYRPYNRYQVDLEDASKADQFAEEAKKQHELQHLAQAQRQLPPGQTVKPADGNGVHQHHESEVESSDPPSNRTNEPPSIPDGTVAGSAAPYPQVPGQDPYLAPSAAYIGRQGESMTSIP